MNGTELIDLLPEQPTQVRRDRILQAVQDADFLPIVWKSVTARHQDGRVFTIQVANDAFKLGAPDDFFRSNFCHADAQRVADLLDCRLPTPKICDLVHLQCDMRIEPCLGQPDSQMAWTHRMVEHSREVTKRIGVPAKLDPLVSTVGKDWVLTNGYPNNYTGANYGWHCPTGKYVSPCGIKMWQPLGFAHNLFHVDYSQTLRLVGRYCDVTDQNGAIEELELDAVLTDPQLAQLFSYEGVLKWTRHPGVSKS